jgi:hypothetical protein
MLGLDRPVPFARGRTVRELVLLSLGVGYVAYELLQPDTMWLNVAIYSLATVLFALRFFPARALGVGVALGALAQRLPDLRLADAQLYDPHVYIALGVIALLASRDLEARFERAPSRLSWLPNAWAELPARDMRLLRACAYALGALAAVLYFLWGPPFWGSTAFELARLLGSLGFLTLTIGLLAAGRAPALFLVPLVCVPIAIFNAMDVPLAEQTLATGGFVYGGPQYVLPAAALATIATILAAPYCVRLVRRAAA